MRVGPPPGYNPPVPRSAATVILLREKNGEVETVLLRRPGYMAFAGGALVFPGGRCDEADLDPALLARSTGITDLPVENAALIIAAIRETFEECGILLARAEGQGGFVAPERAAAYWPQREAMAVGTLTFAEFVEAEKLRLAGDQLRPLCRWVTPWWEPKRYDTHFFIAEAPAGQEPLHENREVEEVFSMTPRAACEAAAAGEVRFLPPTATLLDRLSRTASLAEALAIEAHALEVPIEPWLERSGTRYRVDAALPAAYRIVRRREHLTLAELGINGNLAAAIEAAR